MNLLYIHGRPVDSHAVSAIQVAHMCRALQQAGAQVTLGVPGLPGSEAASLRAVEDLTGDARGIRAAVYAKSTLLGRFSMIGGCRGVRDLLRRERPEVCYTRNPAYLGAALALGVPCVFESHDPVIHDLAPWNAWWTRLLLRCSRDPRLLVFVTISRALADLWQSRGVPAAKILAAHDGADPAPYISPDMRPELRRRLGLPTDGKLAVYSGNLRPNRGVDRILRLASAFPDVHFAILGGPADQAGALRQQASALGLRNVVLTGPVAHAAVPEYLGAADILLMTWTRRIRTINYCSPLKLFEYMAAGRIIVGDAFPTILEVLTQGRDALLVEPEAAPALRDAFARALAMDYPSAMADSARRLLAATYTWEQRGRLVHAAIRSALTGRGRP